jgi:hypothetical protein
LVEARAEAAKIIAENVKAISEIDPKLEPERFKAFVSNEKRQNDLHWAGDVFAHVDSEGVPYKAGSGHAVDSVASAVGLSEHEPDTPAKNADAYKLMSTTIYNATKSIMGTPNHDEATVNSVIEAVTKIKDGNEVLSRAVVNTGLPTKDGLPIAEPPAPEPSLIKLLVTPIATPPKQEGK